MKKTVSVLLVEDSSEDATWIQLALKKSENVTFEVDHVEWLSSAITAIGVKGYDVVLLDLTLPDSHGIDTLVSFTNSAPSVPTVVLTGYDDMETAMRCMRYGAQDYQLKGDVKPAPLERSIMYAIERRHRDMVGKRLIRASLSQFTESDEAQPVTVALLKEHIGKIPEAISDIVEYVQKNAPQCSDDIRAIIESYSMPTVLREMREISSSTGRVRMPSGTHRLAHKTIRDLKAIAHVQDPVDIPTAQEALAGIIEDLGNPLQETRDDA